jgi:hypothetical protein
MRIGSVLMLVGVVVAAEGAVPNRSHAQWMAFFDKENRAFALRPSRRDSPLRYENIRDTEVAEIRRVAASVVPRAIVNISGVVEGCPCEDGPACSEQVWILAYRSDKTVGLLLSKIKGQWTIGPVQQWWLNYEDLQSRAGILGHDAFWDARDMLIEQFPAACKRKSTVSTDAVE